MFVTVHTIQSRHNLKNNANSFIIRTSSIGLICLNTNKLIKNKMATFLGKRILYSSFLISPIINAKFLFFLSSSDGH